jgi:hypothetical protein
MEKDQKSYNLTKPFFKKKRRRFWRHFRSPRKLWLRLHTIRFLVHNDSNYYLNRHIFFWSGKTWKKRSFVKYKLVKAIKGSRWWKKWKKRQEAISSEYSHKKRSQYIKKFLHFPRWSKIRIARFIWKRVAWTRKRRQKIFRGKDRRHLLRKLINHAVYNNLKKKFLSNFKKKQRGGVYSPVKNFKKFISFEFFLLNTKFYNQLNLSHFAGISLQFSKTRPDYNLITSRANYFFQTMQFYNNPYRLLSKKALSVLLKGYNASSWLRFLDLLDLGAMQKNIAVDLNDIPQFSLKIKGCRSQPWKLKVQCLKKVFLINKLKYSSIFLTFNSALLKKRYYNIIVASAGKKRSSLSKNEHFERITELKKIWRKYAINDSIWGWCLMKNHWNFCSPLSENYKEKKKLSFKAKKKRKVLKKSFKKRQRKKFRVLRRSVISSVAAFLSYTKSSQKFWYSKAAFWFNFKARLRVLFMRKKRLSLNNMLSQTLVQSYSKYLFNYVQKFGLRRRRKKPSYQILSKNFFLKEKAKQRRSHVLLSSLNDNFFLQRFSALKLLQSRVIKILAASWLNSRPHKIKPAVINKATFKFYSRKWYNFNKKFPLLYKNEQKTYQKTLVISQLGWYNIADDNKLKLFKKYFNNWFRFQYRRIQKNTMFLKTMYANFLSLTGYSEKELFKLWKNFRYNAHSYTWGFNNLLFKFSQSLLLTPSNFLIFLRIAPSQVSAKFLIQSGALVINSYSSANYAYFIMPGDLVQITPKIMQYSSKFFKYHKWNNIKLKASYFTFLQIDWSLFLISLVRWPFNY